MYVAVVQIVAGPVIYVFTAQVKLDYAAWRSELEGVREKHPMSFPQPSGDLISPQHAIQVLHEVTEGQAIITTGVGQHQMFAAQW